MESQPLIICPTTINQSCRSSDKQPSNNMAAIPGPMPVGHRTPSWRLPPAWHVTPSWRHTRRCLPLPPKGRASSWRGTATRTRGSETLCQWHSCPVVHGMASRQQVTAGKTPRTRPWGELRPACRHETARGQVALAGSAFDTVVHHVPPPTGTVVCHVLMWAPVPRGILQSALQFVTALGRK